METKLLFVQTLSPLQAGTGQGIGVIDKPIAREKSTNIPFLPGSSIKGVLRDACAELKCGKVEEIFGPPTDNADAYAGSVSISDARLLLMPVRSLAGVFAWVTSPFILNRFKRDLKEIDPGFTPPDFSAFAQEACLVPDLTSSILIDAASRQVILEDLKLTAAASDALNQWATWLGGKIFAADANWQAFLKKRLCLVSDDTLSYLLEIGTEVTARICIDDDTRTVANNLLWYEEALPAEAVLSSVMVASGVKATPAEVFKALSSLTEKTLQFGGSATVGRGLCRTVLVP